MNKQQTVAEILEAAAVTWRERNALYRDNFRQVGAILHVLHGPEAPVPLSQFEADPRDLTRFNLYSSIIGKLTRFANSGLTHLDSIRDLIVYASMVEALVQEENAQREAAAEEPSKQPPNFRKTCDDGAACPFGCEDRICHRTNINTLAYAGMRTHPGRGGDDRQ